MAASELNFGIWRSAFLRFGIDLGCVRKHMNVPEINEGIGQTTAPENSVTCVLADFLIFVKENNVQFRLVEG